MDCISCIVMRESGVSQALTFDQHFVQADFQALMREPLAPNHRVAELERGFKTGQDTHDKRSFSHRQVTWASDAPWGFVCM